MMKATELTLTGNDHRSRLIKFGLFHPLDQTERSKRAGLIKELAITYAERQKLHQQPYRPCYCVFRADDPFHHVQAIGFPEECQTAELIEDHLYYYEASNLADCLNYKDIDHLPPRPNPHLPPLPLYKICSMDEWEQWLTKHDQLTLLEG